MKIFEKDFKMNFVDDRNVFVGFAYESSCCESFGWRIDLKIPDSFEFVYDDLDPVGDHGINTDGWVFDPKFIYERGDSFALDFGGAVSFRLLKNNEEAGFLTLWNAHNGYYRHGFQMKDEDLVIHDSDL